MIAFSLFDAVLGLALVGIAVRVLTTSDLFQAIVLFIVFGLLMSLAWTRLRAVDVALAEAAIGAGLTGALFLNALVHAASRDEKREVYRRSARSLALLGVMGLALGFAILFGGSFIESRGDGLGALVQADLARSGASNPVTAVLLNFRAYDTLLEIAVLVVAVAGVWALGPATAAAAPVSPPPGPVLLALVRVLIPLIGVVAGYLLWIGTSAPGGAFQAGAVLCAAGILLTVTGIVRGPDPGTWSGRTLIALGFAGFLIVALGVMVWERNFLQYPPDLAPRLILLVEALLTVSIATILVALFTGDAHGRP